MNFPTELSAALIALAIALLAVGGVIVRSYGKLVSSNLELASAKRDHEKAEVTNQSKLEALAVEIAQKNAQQNAMLQDAITKLTAEFSSQIGEITGKLSSERDARHMLEKKFEEVSEQKQQVAQQLLMTRETLRQTEVERDKLKADVAAMGEQLKDLPKLRQQVDDYKQQIESYTVEMHRQAGEIRQLKELQEARHKQINEWQASEMERKVEVDLIKSERDGLRQSEAKLRLEVEATRTALASANEYIARQAMELDLLKNPPKVPLPSDIATEVPLAQ